MLRLNITLRTRRRKCVLSRDVGLTRDRGWPCYLLQRLMFKLYWRLKIPTFVLYCSLFSIILKQKLILMSARRKKIKQKVRCSNSIDIILKEHVNICRNTSRHLNYCEKRVVPTYLIYLHNLLERVTNPAVSTYDDYVMVIVRFLMANCHIWLWFDIINIVINFCEIPCEITCAKSSGSTFLTPDELYTL